MVRLLNNPEDNKEMGEEVKQNVDLLMKRFNVRNLGDA
eukprot:CAMPEP_0170549784 /NCGR_PEP_ID=MMETSP0211-20121228/7935_1 /TAXON_ID=311385 /ORGANISM="Pseudokeronopsis sp., Strain OXSARD2" /LENGTH=37 /DNA_ID= /DNA_START= /DNA_END= /DNA_ORIENTATION=